MTTVAERIAQLTAAAAARGIAVNRQPLKPKNKAARLSSPPHNPATAADIPNPNATARRIAAKLRQPLPCAWMPGDCYKVKETETKLAAGLICKALGKEWHRSESHGHGIRLVHRSGLRLTIHANTWPKKDRYSIGLEGRHAATLRHQSPFRPAERRSRSLATSATGC